MYGYIYKTTNLINGKIYIGQKKSSKILNSYIGSGSIMRKAIQKYGKENFKREIIDICNSHEELQEKEMYWIAYYNARNPEIGYNIKEGGNSSPCVEYVRNKISNTLKNHPVSEKTRKKMSEKTKENAIKYKGTYGMTGKKQSDLCKEINSRIHKGKEPINKGKHPSQETIEKLRKSHLGKSPANKGIPLSDKTKEKISSKKKGQIWISKDLKVKQCPKEKLDYYLSNRWIVGKILKQNLLYHYDLDKNLLNVFTTLKEASEKTGFKIQDIKYNYNTKDYSRLNCIFLKEKK